MSNPSPLSAAVASLASTIPGELVAILTDLLPAAMGHWSDGDLKLLASGDPVARLEAEIDLFDAMTPQQRERLEEAALMVFAADVDANADAIERERKACEAIMDIVVKAVLAALKVMPL